MDALFGAIIELYREKHLPDLELSTQRANSYLLDSCMKPRFGAKRITVVTPLAVLEWFEELALILQLYLLLVGEKDKGPGLKAP